LIGFIFILNYDYNLEKYNLLVYYLVQTLRSFIYLFGSILLINKDFGVFFIILSLLTKIGIPPFYLWYLKILNNLNWWNLYLITTLQKIIPIVALNNTINIKLYEYNLILIILILFRISWRRLIGLNQISLKLIIGYSSIIQLRWIIILIYFNEKLVIEYFLVYLIISGNLIITFKKFNLLYLGDIFSIQISHINKFYILILRIIYIIISWNSSIFWIFNKMNFYSKNILYII
jgi:NADH:ubiquinone oxidoreductase subunit 2 (subunit N)